MCKPVDAPADTKASFYAISSPPSAESNSFEFLIKDLPPYVKANSPIMMSPPMGKGFPIESQLLSLTNDFPAQDVLMFAAGSGIAPLRSVIESNILSTQKRNLSLFIGVKELSHLAYTEKFSDWKKKFGVTNIVACVSRGEEGMELPANIDCEVVSGYCTSALEELDAVVVPRNTGVLLCGMKGMCESVTDYCVKKGVAKERCLTNF